MRTFRMVWGLASLVLLTSAFVSTVGAQGPTTKTRKPDLSIPILDPKPLVWLQDWPGVPEVPPAREKAGEVVDEADSLKVDGEYAQAEKQYLAAIQADPTWAYPHYQLACNYELWGKSDKASASFDQAIKLGFDEFPTALADDELGKIRQRPDFNQILGQMRDRYVASSASKVGQPIGVHPEGKPPMGGWPVMLLLHGFGDSNVSYIDQAEAWAEQGFVAIAVPGTVPASAGSYQWANDSVEPTHRDLQAVLKSPLLKGIVNPKRVYLLGFSQGALHSLILVSQKPDDYAGVVALSPGGSLSAQIMNPALKQSRTCVFIHGSKEPHAPIAARWKAACEKAGWKYLGKVHPGAHQFPENWPEILPEVSKFLTTGK